ncbi:glycerol-3-phosphate acyltransferase [Halospina denitrificans]|uniref:Glycerol-3-phosphate acyltransferase n=1 Tax=Halospina denitrificans TaxID=332522 RepID=A0A4R7JKK5_9GAMM|nr:glycerol-3-phosphate 1-O-acyltransferase PlsB [Halospina denitrificans]TDT38522.1 glycerol-3-phosphate acyltransferase [Halospina denitrificans]
MRSLTGLTSLLLTLLRKFLYLWVRSKVVGASRDQLDLDPEKPVCYVIQHNSLSSRLVLEQELRRAGLPSAEQRLSVPGGPRRSFFFLYYRRVRIRRRRQPPTMTPRLRELVNLSVNEPSLDVQIVPVSLFWGRSPDKERSLLKIILADSWSVTGPLQKFFTILIHGRNLFVQFSRPFSLKDAIAESPNEELAQRKLARVLRVHFRRVRQAVIGPDLSHRRTLVNSLVRSQPVKKAIRETAEHENIPRLKARDRALKYAHEIASNFSMATIRFLEVVLSWLWNRLYDGIRINNIETAQEAAQDNAVVYVPSHRSHIDYLLLSYVLYKNGLMPPHIAAGINLNMPIIGPLLRRGGAFFMRRSFRDNPLYSAVFNEYMHVMFTRGFSVEYFVEGGRSRTGRTLQPRPGMLSMTVRSFLRDPRKPIVFVPVYFGYEKVLEGGSYLGELQGTRKKKEGLLGLVRSVRNLKRSFGQVSVNFGQPIQLAEVLDEQRPGWRTESYDEDYRPEWLPSVVNDLARQTVTRINEAAALNPVNLLATVMLATERLAMDERLLAQLMEDLCNLLRQQPYSDRMTFPEGSGADWIAYNEKMGLIVRRRQRLGDIIMLEGRHAVLMTYYRNNVQHLFAIPALIASLFENNSSLERERLIFLARSIYPYIRSELFLRWDPASIDGILNDWIDRLVDEGLLVAEGNLLYRPAPGTADVVRLSILSHGIIQTLQRYYLSIAILRKFGSNAITAEELEEQSTLLAERVSVLFGLNAPEFFDKTLFRNFIANLQANGILKTDDEGRLSYRSGLEEVAEEARLVLSSELRQSILQVTNVSVPVPEQSEQ